MGHPCLPKSQTTSRGVSCGGQAPGPPAAAPLYRWVPAACCPPSPRGDGVADWTLYQVFAKEAPNVKKLLVLAVAAGGVFFVLRRKSAAKAEADLWREATAPAGDK